MVTLVTGLSHDQWHSVTVTLDLVTSQLTITLDSLEEKILALKSPITGERLREPLISILSVGGRFP